jgi:PleD family two-component response regulator
MSFLCFAARCHRRSGFVRPSYRPRASAPALDDELRSCLAAIVGHAVLLDSDDPQARSDALRRIVTSVQHLSATLERLRPADAAGGAEAAGGEATAPRVVVVDEDPVSRGLLKRMLPVRFELLEAGDQEDALRLAGMDNVEFVVLAWRASAFSGPQALAELKIRYPDLRVMVIAEADDDVYKGVAESLGADEFLTRPLNSLQLLAAADELLRSGEEPQSAQGPAKTASGF